MRKFSCSIIASKRVKFEISSLWTKALEKNLKRKKLLSNPEKKDAKIVRSVPNFPKVRNAKYLFMESGAEKMMKKVNFS